MRVANCPAISARPPWQGARHTVQYRITRGPGMVVRRTEAPVPRGRRWPMRQGLWPTVWHRIARRPGVVRRWPGGIRRARPIEGPQEAKPAPWVVAEELPIPTCGILLGKHPLNGVEMADFCLMEVV